MPSIIIETFHYENPVVCAVSTASVLKARQTRRSCSASRMTVNAPGYKFSSVKDKQQGFEMTDWQSLFEEQMAAVKVCLWRKQWDCVVSVCDSLLSTVCRGHPHPLSELHHELQAACGSTGGVRWCKVTHTIDEIRATFSLRFLSSHSKLHRLLYDSLVVLRFYCSGGFITQHAIKTSMLTFWTLYLSSSSLALSCW